MICQHCGRGVAPEHHHSAPGICACSIQCLTEAVVKQRHKDQREYTESEEAAIEEGGKAAGAYLEGIGQTDLRNLTKPQWLEFLTAFDRARSAYLRDLIPF